MDKERFIRDTAKGLLDQGKFAFSEEDGRCLYRDAQGNKCAIGLHFSADADVSDVAHDSAEDAFLNKPTLFADMIDKYGPITGDDVRFLTLVQSFVHDIPALRWNKTPEEDATHFMLTPDAAVEMFVIREYLTKKEEING